MPTYNRLLDAMPQALFEKLAPALKKASLQLGDRLHEPGEAIRHLYFPLNCVLSITILVLVEQYGVELEGQEPMKYLAQ